MASRRIAKTRVVATRERNRLELLIAGELNAMVGKALKAHKEILDSRHLAPGDAARMTAVKEVYDRTFGKVVQQTEVHAVVEKKDFSDVVADVVMDLDMDEEEVEE